MERRTIHTVVIVALLGLMTACAPRENADVALLREMDHYVTKRTEYAVPSEQQIDSLRFRLNDSMSHYDRFELYGRLLECYRSNDLDSQQYYAELRMEMAQTPFERQVSLLNCAEIMMRRDSTALMRQYIDSALQQPLNPALAPYYYQTLYPVMESAYHKQVRRRYYWMIAMVVTALLSLGLLAFFLLYVNRKRHQLAILNDRLAQTNEDLRRSNRIKTVYVKRFMKMTNISDFDDAFLELFPDFVMQIQTLLVPDAELRIKSNERLNTDLRVLALIYLGITDSKQIADILRYSLPTIYNSRTRMRNLAKEDRTNFEDKVAAL